LKETQRYTYKHRGTQKSTTNFYRCQVENYIFLFSFFFFPFSFFLFLFSLAFLGFQKNRWVFSIKKDVPKDAPTQSSYHNPVSRVNEKLQVSYDFYSLHEFENTAL